MEYLVFPTLGNIQSEVLGEYFTDKTLGLLSFLSADRKDSTHRCCSQKRKAMAVHFEDKCQV